jgi:hypothetical protein
MPKPEKWKIGERSEADNTLSIVEVGTKRTFTVCYVCPMPHFDDRQVERAHMIAATPRLLAALKRANFILSDHDLFASEEVWCDDVSKVQGEVAAAIKDAEALNA